MHPQSTVGASTAVLAETALFRNLASDQLDAAVEHVRQKSFPAGAHVVTADQPAAVVFVILSGTVKIEVDQPDGSNVILAVLGPGDSVGEMSLGDKMTHPASAVTIDECTLAWIDRTTFSEFLLAWPQLARNLASVLTTRLRIANAHIQSLARHDVHGRVAHQLLLFADAYGVDSGNGGTLIPLRLTQGDLASLVGASRVRVNQVLSLYKQRGYISVHKGHQIAIRNQAALAARCG